MPKKLRKVRGLERQCQTFCEFRKKTEEHNQREEEYRNLQPKRGDAIEVFMSDEASSPPIGSVIIVEVWSSWLGGDIATGFKFPATVTSEVTVQVRLAQNVRCVTARCETSHLRYRRFYVLDTELSGLLQRTRE